MIYKVFVSFELGGEHEELLELLSLERALARTRGILSDGLHTALGFVGPGAVLSVQVVPVREVAVATESGGAPAEDDTSDEALDGLIDLLGVGEEVARALYNAGIRSVEDVQAATDEELLDVPHIGKATLAGIRKQVT